MRRAPSTCPALCMSSAAPSTTSSAAAVITSREPVSGQQPEERIEQVAARRATMSAMAPAIERHRAAAPRPRLAGALSPTWREQRQQGQAAARPPCPGTGGWRRRAGRRRAAAGRALRRICSAIAVADMASASPATTAPRQSSRPTAIGERRRSRLRSAPAARRRGRICPGASRSGGRARARARSGTAASRRQARRPRGCSSGVPNTARP